MKSVKLCSECGHIAYWDSYFRCYCCTNSACNYMEKVKGGCSWCEGELILLSDGKYSVGIKNGKLQLLQKVGRKLEVTDERDIKKCPMCGMEIGSP